MRYLPCRVKRFLSSLCLLQLRWESGVEIQAGCVVLGGPARPFLGRVGNRPRHWMHPSSHEIPRTGKLRDLWHGAVHPLSTGPANDTCTVRITAACSRSSISGSCTMVAISGCFRLRCHPSLRPKTTLMTGFWKPFPSLPRVSPHAPYPGPWEAMLTAAGGGITYICGTDSVISCQSLILSNRVSNQFVP